MLISSSTIDFICAVVYINIKKDEVHHYCYIDFYNSQIIQKIKVTHLNHNKNKTLQ
jgi:hypothetical protein